MFSVHSKRGSYIESKGAAPTAGRGRQIIVGLLPSPSESVWELAKPRTLCGSRGAPQIPRLRSEAVTFLVRHLKLLGLLGG